MTRKTSNWKKVREREREREQKSKKEREGEKEKGGERGRGKGKEKVKCISYTTAMKSIRADVLNSVMGYIKLPDILQTIIEASCTS